MHHSIKKHKHTWIIILVAISLVMLMHIFLPEKKMYSRIVIGLAGGHLVLVLVTIFTGWILIPQKFFNKKLKAPERFDFGYTSKWIHSLGFASVIIALLAVHLFFAFKYAPALQLFFYSFFLLFAVNLYIGFLMIRNTKRLPQLTLPMVSLLPGNTGTILDAGCGAGRTTIAIAKAYHEAQIVSFDKFNARYIEDGGSKLLQKNISLAGITHRVEAIQGDITATPFINNQFDAIISSFMFDHLGNKQQNALIETYRILKPGGRFLLIIMVRGYTMFGIASFISLILTTRNQWIIYMQRAGFKIIEDGKINLGNYFLLEKESE